MKKVIFAILALTFLTPAFADGMAKLRLNISGPTKGNSYFLCVYGLGCISMNLATTRHKEYTIMSSQMWNMKKIIIANGNNMRLYRQPMSGSCKVHVPEGQSITLHGQLVVKNNTPYLSNVYCSVT